MKDSNKIVEGETTPETQNDLKKEKTKPSVVKKSEVGNKSKTEPKVIKPVNEKGTKTDIKIAVEEASKAERVESEVVVGNELDLNTELEKPDSGKKKIEVLKKNTKKAEEKVDKLKKKVKKAKKKEVKKSKLKALKEKLGKAFDKLKASVKKLKKAKK
ncbi:MAG: hypothetical protein JZU47_15685 [Prolixibacteraceae bacterium]|nr:hypothetical protein [Prolixibacteraceae bacterium]